MFGTTKSINITWSSDNRRFYAFDLLWLDGTDLRSLALSGRKALLRKLLPRKAHAVRYVEHVANGTDLFRVICDRDMEGIVAKQASAHLHAGSNDLGEDQESAVQPGDRTLRLFRPPETSISSRRLHRQRVSDIGAGAGGKSMPNVAVLSDLRPEE
jgi:hypothetical protein